MAVEIERKFLVRSEAWRSLARSEADIRQAYLASGERSTTRVRIKNGTDATVTIKSKRAELRRLEIEYPISALDAEALLSLRQSGFIEKTRFTIPWRGHLWEVDVFSGDNAGLVIAEIELRHEDEPFDRPQRVPGAVSLPTMGTTAICGRRGLRQEPFRRAHIQAADRISWMERAHELPAFDRYPPRQ